MAEKNYEYSCYLSCKNGEIYDVVSTIMYLHAGDKIVCHDPASGGCEVVLSGKEYFNLTR